MIKRWKTLLALIALPAGLTTAAGAAADAQDKVLRVCADPNNLPLSNDKREGYENKIAELFAEKLGWKVDYTWFPQRMGFIRNTLRAKVENSDRYKCDLVMGVPVGFELAATTKPYLRSTYALAYLKGKGLDSVRTPEDLLKLDPSRLKSLRLGVFSQTPPVDWLIKHNLFDQAVSYQRQSGDPAAYPGEIIEKDLASGKIDVAFVWGPIAGYFGRKSTNAEVAVVPFPSDKEIKFDYSIAMGVRYGEKEWKEQVEKLIEANREPIRDILASYGVPQLDETGHVMEPEPRR